MGERIMRTIGSVFLCTVLTAFLAVAGGRSINSTRPAPLKVAPAEDFYTQRAPTIPWQPTRTVRLALNPANGDTITTTDYDYGWNHPTNHNAISYAPSPALPGTQAHFAVMRRTIGGPRAMYYVYYDGSNYIGAATIPTTVRATGYGNIDIFKGGSIDGIVAISSHTPTAIAFNGFFGDTTFSSSDIPNQPPNQLDPKVALDQANQIVYCMTTGRDRTVFTTGLDYWLWKSSDYGTSWVFVDSLAQRITTVTPGDRAIEVLDPDFQVTANGDIYVFLVGRAKSASGTSVGLPPLGTGTTSTVNRFGYLKSTNQGASWTWTDAYLEGSHLTFDAGDTLDYGCMLSNGFVVNNGLGHTAGCVDANGVVHLVMNGDALHLIDSVTFHYVFGIFYWDSQHRTWTQVSRSSDTHNPINDLRDSRQYCTGFVGAPGGRSHPSIAYYPGSRDIFVAWSEPTINGTFEDTLNARWVNQVWYNHSPDGGATWDGATELTPTSSHSGKYFTNVARELTLAGGSTNTLRAHIVYINDSDNRNFVSTASGGGDVGAVDMMKPYIYQTVDFAMTGVGENPQQPKTFTLSQNYPNPFNPGTVIIYSLPSASNVTLTVYNMVGQQVATLVNGREEAGTHEAKFAASRFASGVYFYALRAGSYSATRKMILMK